MCRHVERSVQRASANYLSQLEFLHCAPVGSKPGSDMPNMAVPDLNKI